MKRFFYIAIAVVVLAATMAMPLAAQTLTIIDKGAGMYTDPSVVNQASTFTLNPNQVSCGVGTLNANGSIGPFEMLMYSLTIDTYNIDRNTLTITATGKMRSITRVSGVVVEDTNGSGTNPPPHDYIAIGNDRSGSGGLLGNGRDHFEIHFKTPFWNTSNPMCTPSNIVAGGCKFGGDLFLGEINVTPAQ